MLTDKQQFALIDMSNLKFFVSIRRRAANMCFCLMHRDDVSVLSDIGFDRIMELYLRQAQLNHKEEIILMKWFHRFFKKRVAFYQKKGLLTELKENIT